MTSDTLQYNKRKQYSVLTMNTVAFTANFAVWTMFSVIGIKIKDELNLNETEFGLLVATPILTGSIVRLPLGLLTDRFGGRVVYFIQMLLVAIPTYGLVLPINIGSTSPLDSASAWPAVRSPSASPTPPPGSRKSGKERRWAFSAPATPARH